MECATSVVSSESGRSCQLILVDLSRDHHEPVLDRIQATHLQYVWDTLVHNSPGVGYYDPLLNAQCFMIGQAYSFGQI